MVRALRVDPGVLLERRDNCIIPLTICFALAGSLKQSNRNVALAAKLGGSPDGTPMANCQANPDPTHSHTSALGYDRQFAASDATSAQPSNSDIRTSDVRVALFIGR